jgi:type IV pilus assembly protein PilB
MEPTAKALELLSNIDLFMKLDPRELKALAEIAESELHKAARIIFRQGDPSDYFCVVLSGTYECYLWEDLLKIERSICVFNRGDVFGEMGLLTDDKRSAFVRARTAGEVLKFSREAFLGLLARDSRVALSLAKTLAQRLNAANKARGIKLEQIASYPLKKEVVQVLPLQVILRHKVLPMARHEDQITIGIVDPSDQIARNTVAEFLKNLHVQWVCLSQPDFENFRDKRLFDMLNDQSKAAPGISAELVYLSSKGSAPADATSASGKLLDEIISTAIDAGASDLHFEPGPAGVAVRARIDGRLVDLAPSLGFNIYKPIVSRVKALSDLDITETRLPQDAVLRLRYGARNIDFRVSTVPSPRAEAVVCRLFDPQSRKLDFDNLIASRPIGDLVKKLFYLPSGLVLVTGPTGSGKTTTLYAGIQARQQQSPASKLVTVEDPVEYELSGATQIQVNTAIGLTFETILRSALRQDPDIILIGEIRDKTSMEIALEAALTGHVVFSSMHTNDVFETVMRLRQRGIEPYVIASALRGVVSQRLVSRLCSACVEEYSMEDETLSKLRASGIIDSDSAIKGWKAPGCSHCRMTGRRGRMGLYEVLVVTPELRESIEREESGVQMEKLASPGSYLPMKSYARFVLEKGLVSAEDLLEILPAAVET